MNKKGTQENRERERGRRDCAKIFGSAHHVACLWASVQKPGDSGRLLEGVRELPSGLCRGGSKAHGHSQNGGKMRIRRDPFRFGFLGMLFVAVISVVLPLVAMAADQSQSQLQPTSLSAALVSYSEATRVEDANGECGWWWTWQWSGWPWEALPHVTTCLMHEDWPNNCQEVWTQGTPACNTLAPTVWNTPRPWDWPWQWTADSVAHSTTNLAWSTPWPWDWPWQWTWDNVAQNLTLAHLMKNLDWRNRNRHNNWDFGRWG